MLFRARAQQFYFFSLYLAAFVTSLPFSFGSGSLLLVVFFWLLSLNPKKFATNFLNRKLLWFSIAFFLLHAISYFYSIDKYQSSMDIERKLCFLGLPLVIGCGPEITLKKLENILFAFVIGLTLSISICFYNAIHIWSQTGATKQFFYHALVHGFDANAVYFSFYTITSIAILLLYTWESPPLRSIWLRYFLLSIQIIFLILLSSKMLILFFAFILFPLFLIKTKKKQLIITRLFGFIAAIGLFLIIAYTNNPIHTRFQDILKNDENKAWMSSDPNGKHFNSLSLRLFLWKTALANIEENNLWWKGCGNGDVEIYQKRKLEQYYAGKNPDWQTPLWQFNLHNEYMQVLMMLGIPGLSVFLLMIFLPLFFVRKVKHCIVFFIFFLVSAMFMLQESAFQTQAAFLFYSFFLNIFWNVYYSEKEKQLQPSV